MSPSLFRPAAPQARVWGSSSGRGRQSSRRPAGGPGRSGSIGPAAAQPHVSRTRFSTRGPAARRGTDVSFRLARRANVELVVRGPSPSCAIVGKQTVHGHPGLNRVRFSGRLRGRRLAPAPTPSRWSPFAVGARRRVGTIGIEVVSPRRRLTKAERSAPVSAYCASKPGAKLTRLVLSLGGTARGDLRQARRDRKPGTPVCLAPRFPAGVDSPRFGPERVARARCSPH